MLQARAEFGGKYFRQELRSRVRWRNLSPGESTLNLDGALVEFPDQSIAHPTALICFTATD